MKLQTMFFQILLIGAYIVTVYLFSVEGIGGFIRSVLGVGGGGDGSESESRAIVEDLFQTTISLVSPEWKKILEEIR
jgi:hypothetical protein